MAWVRADEQVTRLPARHWLREHHGRLPSSWLCGQPNKGGRLDRTVDAHLTERKQACPILVRVEC